MYRSIINYLLINKGHIRLGNKELQSKDGSSITAKFAWLLDKILKNV